MKRLKLALLTLLLPIMAFAAETINFRDLTDNRNYNFTHVTTLTAIKGKKEQWRFQVSDLENERSSPVFGTWTVENQPTWLTLKTNITSLTNSIAFEGIVPTDATTSANFKLTFTPTSGTALNQTYTINITDPQIQYHSYTEGVGSTWSNETELNFIKGKNEYYNFRTSSELEGIWEVIGEKPDWLRTDVSKPNRPIRQASISGLAPVDATNATITLKVTDEAGSVATKTYSIKILTPETPTITTSTLGAGEVGLYYSAKLATSSIYAEWYIESGSLPPGLTLYSNGYIDGYPTTTGTFNFAVKSHNITGENTKSLSITIDAATTAPEFENLWRYGELDEETGIYTFHVQEGVSYIGFTLSRVPTSVPTIKSGSLPTGITIKRSTEEYEVDYIFSGNLSYKTTGNNTYEFTVEATNSKGSTTQKFTIIVEQAEEAPVISSDIYIPEEVYVGQSYYGSLSLTEWVGAAWTVTGLPSGLTASNNGNPQWLEITGIPTQSGTFSVTAKANNSIGSSSKTFVITILKPTKPNITTNSLPEGRVHLTYSKYIEANTESAIWTITSGSLPPGLYFEYCDGSGFCWIEGKPTDKGTYTFTVKAENVSGNSTKTYTIVVRDPVVPTISTTTLPNAEVGPHYSVQLEAADEAEWSITDGSLPAGLTLGINGHISGSATATGTSTFTVKAHNDTGSDTKQLTIVVEDPPAPDIAMSITDFSGKVGQPLDILLVANGYVASWELASGSSLPTGFSISNGSLEGKATEAGEHTFSLIAKNAGGSSEPVEFTLTITEPVAPVISTSSLASGTVGQSYNQTLNAGDYAEWSITSGSLPSGLSLDYSGSIFGTPTVAGTYTFTLTATNVSGTVSKQFSLKINSSSSGGGTTPIISLQTTISNISVRATNNAIVLENLPSNVNIEVYNLLGKRIYSVNSANSQSLQIQVPKGMYVVKTAKQTLRAVVK